MWSPIVKLLLSFWRELLIALLLVALTASISLGRKISAEYKDAQVSWKFQVAQAQEASIAATTNAQIQVEKLNAKHSADLEQARKTASENFEKGKLAAIAAVRARADRVRVATPTPAAADTHAGAEAPDGAAADPVADYTAAVIQQCADTTVLFNEWRELCAGNPQLCKVKE